MILEYFKIATGSIKQRRLRSWLTLIGIFIGIAAVVSLISIGQGLQTVIEDEFMALGANKIIIQPPGSNFGTGGGSSANPLTKDDVEVLEKVSGVKTVAYARFNPGRVEWGEEFQIAYVVGIPPDEKGELISEMMRLDRIESGSMLRTNEKNAVYAGYNYGFSNKYDTLIKPGRKITINENEFTVTGIKQSEGNAPDDTTVYINEKDFEEIFDVGDEVNMIVLEVLPGRLPSEVILDVEEALRKHRDVKKGQEDFEAETFENVLKSFMVLINVVQAIIIGIASISLFVGAVGITNTMYTAVLERTKEIGIMKAIGAKNSDIQNMFLIESGLLGFAGGVIGVLIGMGLSKIIELLLINLANIDYLKPIFPPWLIIGALAFAFILGAVSGSLPARQAAKLNPVDALATE